MIEIRPILHVNDVINFIILRQIKNRILHFIIHIIQIYFQKNTTEKKVKI